VLATSRGLRDSLLADWLWPSAPTMVLHVNQPAGITTTAHVQPDTVKAAIDMLVQLNDLQDQSDYARGLVAALAYRPIGYNIFGTPGLVGVRIRLPTLQTLGQFMQPLSLANTTLEPPTLPPPNYISPTAELQNAAICSMNYLYHLHRALSVNRSPSWWPAPYKKAYARRFGSVSLVTANGWFAARVALTRDADEGTRAFPASMLHVWPAKAAECRTLASRAMIKGVDVLAWHNGPSLDDPSLAPLAKVSLNTQVELLPCGFDVPIATLTTEANLAHTLPTLWRAGCEAVLRVTNLASGLPVERKVIAEHVAQTLSLPENVLPWLSTQLMVNIPDWQAALALKRNQLLDADASWYIHTPMSQYAPTPDTSIPSQPTHTPDEPLHIHRSPDPTPTKQTSPKHTHADPPKPPSEDHLDDPDYEADGLTPAMPPDSVVALPHKDPIIDVIVRHATTLVRPPVLVALDAIPGWTVPTELLDDEPALKWIIDSIPCTLSSVNAYGGTTATSTLLHKTAEAIRLRQMRQMERRLAEAGDIEGKDAVRHAIETLEGELPLNYQAGSIADAPIPAAPQATTQDIAAQASEPPPASQPAGTVPPQPAAFPPVHIPQEGGALVSISY
jgi:hypothetical protein